MAETVVSIHHETRARHQGWHVHESFGLGLGLRQLYLQFVFMSPIMAGKPGYTVRLGYILR